MIITKPYVRENAITYARKWALARNPLFVDFAGFGGDCTSFVSQCVLAGSCTMNFTKDFGWYYVSASDRSAAWSGVEFFHKFMTRAWNPMMMGGGVGPFGTEVRRRFAAPGDVVQLADEEGDYYHTLIISEINGDEILVCAHTNDAKDRALSSYDYYAERFIHIEGVREETDDGGCFVNLINGISLPLSDSYYEG